MANYGDEDEIGRFAKLEKTVNYISPVDVSTEKYGSTGDCSQFSVGLSAVIVGAMLD